MNGIPSDLANTGDIACYSCGHAYDHLGRDDHPGRCPACESRAVDVVEPIAVERAEGQPSVDGRSLVAISITDATDRAISYEFTLYEDRNRAVLEVALFAEDCVTPERDGWDHGIVPESLTETITERGYEVVMSQVDSPTRSD